LVAKNKKIKYTLPSAVQLALGKGGFAECLSVGARQSIKNTSLPSARDPALGKVYFLILKKSLPSAGSRALGKERFNSCYGALTHYLSLTLTISLSRSLAAVAPPRRRAATRRRARGEHRQPLAPAAPTAVVARPWRPPPPSSRRRPPSRYIPLCFLFYFIFYFYFFFISNYKFEFNSNFTY
jgi:hypothetical protein